MYANESKTDAALPHHRFFPLGPRGGSTSQQKPTTIPTPISDTQQPADPTPDTTMLAAKPKRTFRTQLPHALSFPRPTLPFEGWRPLPDPLPVARHVVQDVDDRAMLIPPIRRGGVTNREQRLGTTGPPGPRRNSVGPGRDRQGYQGKPRIGDVGPVGAPKAVLHQGGVGGGSRSMHTGVPGLLRGDACGLQRLRLVGRRPMLAAASLCAAVLARV